MIKKITLLLAFFFAPQAFADSLVSCQTTTVNPVKVVEYLIKSTPSARLNSPVFYTSGASVISYNQSDVAQFVASKKGLYVLIDNANEIPVLSLTAALNNSKLVGTVSNYSSAGAVIKNTRVVCRATAL